jgi:hypothetical protein
MAGLNSLHESEKNLSVLVGQNLRRTDLINYLTDAQVAGATTAEDLVGYVQGTFVHAEYEQDKLQIIKAIRAGAASGELSDARIQAATSVADLVADTWANAETDQTHLGVPMTD